MSYLLAAMFGACVGYMLAAIFFVGAGNDELDRHH